MQQSMMVQEETGPIAPEAAPENNGERPAWLPENFKTPEDLAKSYAALQAEYTKLTQNKPPQSAEQPPADKTQSPTADMQIDQARETVENAGLNFDKYADEFSSTGKLSDESYAELASKAIPKEIVDEFISLKMGQVETLKSELINSAGGQDNFTAMIQWAATSYSDADAYNKMMASGEPAQMRMAVSALRAAYVASNGSAPVLRQGSNGTPSGEYYRSDAELHADMSKPEYTKDPAFRRQVEEKLARSTNLLR